MNEALLVPLLKSYIGAESREEIENILMQLTAITGFEQEMLFDEIHCQFPHLHDVVVAELKQEKSIRANPIFMLF